MTVTQSSLPARPSVPGTVRNLKCAAGIRVVERLSCFLIQSNMIAADGAIDEIRIYQQLPQAGQESSHLAQHVVWIRQEDIVVGTP